MLKLRTDIPYAASTGKLTQAGVEAIQGQFDAQATTAAGLDTRLSAVEAELAGSLINLQTPVTASGQTSIDFTGIPSWAVRITVIFNELSTSGTSEILVQIGDSGGVEATSYVSTQVGTSGVALAHGSSTAGFRVTTPLTAADIASGTCVLTRVSGDLWIQSSSVKRTTSAMAMGNGSKTLSATLDRVRITMANGTDTFDAGSVNISWE
jgi:hypothetical protein